MDFDDSFVKLDNGRCGMKQYMKVRENIMSLIEQGDYVNGTEVISIEHYAPIINFIDGGSIKENYIKNILTKEQYQNNCYRLEG